MPPRVAANSSSSSSRSAGNRSIGESRAAKETLLAIKNAIVFLAENMEENKADIEDEALVEWKDRIISLTTTAETYCQKEENLNQAIQQIVGKYNESDFSKMKDEDILSEIKDELISKHSEIDPNKNEAIRKVIATIEGRQITMNQEEELIVEEEAMSEQKAKCPYTMMIMEEPMKNDNPNTAQKCIHHISREGLKIMFREKTTDRCAVAGCQGKWLKNMYSLDEDYQRKISRFLKKRDRHGSQLSQSSSRRAGVTAVDLDD